MTIIASSVLQVLVSEMVAGRVRVVDLTRPLGPDTPVIALPEPFGASPGVTMQAISRYDDKGPAWYWNAIALGEHTGTHFDAPVHWITGRALPDNTTDAIHPHRCIGPACVIDATAEAACDHDFLLTVDAIARWEDEHGPIPARSWVLLRTGWSARSGGAFQNVGPDGPHSPGFDVAAARFLAYERDVLGVGAETIGTDAGQAARFDPPFPTHAIMHGAGRFGLASLCNLDQLPPTGAIVVAAPLKLVNGSGSPVRAFALVAA
jgi:kynurenine formamidase